MINVKKIKKVVDFFVFVRYNKHIKTNKNKRQEVQTIETHMNYPIIQEREVRSTKKLSNLPL